MYKSSLPLTHIIVSFWSPHWTHSIFQSIFFFSSIKRLISLYIISNKVAIKYSRMNFSLKVLTVNDEPKIWSSLLFLQEYWFFEWLLQLWLGFVQLSWSMSISSVSKSEQRSYTFFVTFLIHFFLFVLDYTSYEMWTFREWQWDSRRFGTLLCQIQKNRF